jgi:hypothetical protein
MTSPEAIRTQILALVKAYHAAKFAPKTFDPDKDLVHYAGRVFDAEEIVNLVDASLDFYLTANRYAERFEAEFAGYLGLSNARGDALEEQAHDGHLCENPGIFQPPALWFAEDAEIFLSGGVGSFGGGAKGLEFLMPVCSAENLDDQPGEVVDRHMTRGDLRVRHPRRLWGLHWHQEERGSVPGAVFEETGRPSAVLAGDFLTGSDVCLRMAGKGEKDSLDLDWNIRSEILLVSASLPLDQIGDKLWDVWTGEIGF